MRKRRGDRRYGLSVLVVGLVGAAVLALPISSRASGPPTTLPPCPSPPGVLDEISVEWPSLLAWGRKVRIAIDPANAEGFLELWVGDSYVGSVNPEEGGGYPYAPFWVRADRGDQDVPIRFRYGSQDPALPYRAGGNCYREAAKTVRAGRGRLLPYGVRYKARDDLLAFVAKDTYVSGEGCGSYARVSAEMQIQTLGKSRVFRIADQCRDSSDRRISGNGWFASTFNVNGFQEEFPGEGPAAGPVPRGRDTAGH